MARFFTIDQANALLPALTQLLDHLLQVRDHLVARRPDVKVLFASGYTGGALPDEFLTSRQVRLLPKPYGAADLLRAVREVLDD